MAIFEVQETPQPAAQVMAKGFLSEANQEFEGQLQRAYDAVQRFWFRNKTAEGTPSAIAVGDNPEPTGPEILTAMGTNAQAVILVAYKRVEMLLGIEAALGLKDVVDVSKCSPPYTITFKDDGSVDSCTLIE